MIAGLDFSRLTPEQLAKFDRLLSREGLTPAGHKILDDLENLARVVPRPKVKARTRWVDAGWTPDSRAYGDETPPPPNRFGDEVCQERKRLRRRSASRHRRTPEAAAARGFLGR